MAVTLRSSATCGFGFAVAAAQLTIAEHGRQYVWCLFALVFSCSRGVSHLVAAQVPSPIALTGYNLDVVTDANPSVRFASPADIGTADWFEAGAKDGGGTVHNDGLVAGTLVSQFTNSVTAGHTVFQFQPFDGNNTLMMRYPSANTATLTLSVPQDYSSLAILAAGYNAASNGTGTVIINFFNGSHSAPLSYNAFDWGTGTSNVAIGGLGRNFDSGPSGTEFNYNKPTSFGMYETDINLSALGLTASAISSLTFTGGTISDQPGVPNHGPNTNIFAVSGVAVPEPSAFVLATFGSLALLASLLRRRNQSAA